MQRLGDWFKVGDRAGSIQAWGIEIGVSPTCNTPIKKTSRKKAYASNAPHVLLYFGNDIEEWWPVDACTPVPPPLYRIRD